jgi:hypothetical protein
MELSSFQVKKLRAQFFDKGKLYVATKFTKTLLTVQKKIRVIGTSNQAVGSILRYRYRIIPVVVPTVFGILIGYYYYHTYFG